MIRLLVNDSEVGREFARDWAKICADDKSDRRAWIDKLRGQGVKAAHPDDSWVDRQNNTVQFVYPQFNDGTGVGDVVALGNHWRWRLVRVVEIVPGWFTLPDLPPRPHYRFVPCSDAEPLGGE